MNINSFDELAQAFASILPATVVAFEYRIYYNQAGDIVSCSMQQHPETGSYCIATQEQYDRYFDYTVVDGVLTKIVRATVYTKPLILGTSHYPVVQRHAALLIEPPETYTDIEYYDRNL